MLRITRIESAPQITLRLEGQIVGPWVEELRQVCDELPVVLDLAEVTFADEAGVALLANLKARQYPITACSPFLAEQLRRAR